MTAPSLAEMLAPQRTALVIVDVQVDFGSRDGLYGRGGADLSRVDAAVDRMIEMHDAANRAGVFTVFVRLVTGPGTDSLAAEERRVRMGVTGSARPCTEGTRGAEFYRVAPRPGDAEVIKHRYSSFTNTPMDFILKSRPGIDTLVICGLTTECCVDTAIRDAFVRDYHVFFPTDASASYRQETHEGCLRVFGQFFAILTDAAKVTQAWQEAAAARG